VRTALLQVQQIHGRAAKALQELAVVFVGLHHEHGLGDHDPTGHHKHHAQDDDHGPGIGGQVLHQDAHVTFAAGFGLVTGLFHGRHQFAFSALCACGHAKPFGTAHGAGNLQLVRQAVHALTHLKRTAQCRQHRIGLGHFHAVHIQHRFASAHGDRGLRPRGCFQVTTRQIHLVHRRRELARLQAQRQVAPLEQRARCDCIGLDPHRHRDRTVGINLQLVAARPSDGGAVQLGTTGQQAVGLHRDGRSGFQPAQMVDT